MEESSRALEAFQVYCDMGTDRSLERVYAFYQNKAKAHPQEKIKTPALATLKLWSSPSPHGFDWQKKVKAADEVRIAQEATAKRLKKIKALESMDDEQANVARGLWIKTAKLLNDRLDKGDIPTGAAVALLKIGFDMHRLAQGASTAKVEQELSSNPDKPLVITANFGISPTTTQQNDIESIEEDHEE